MSEPNHTEADKLYALAKLEEAAGMSIEAMEKMLEEYPPGHQRAEREEQLRREIMEYWRSRLSRRQI